MWIHEVDIHLAISAWALGVACGLIPAVIISLFDRRKK